MKNDALRQALPFEKKSKAIPQGTKNPLYKV
jgi:hypothetical protein